MIFAARTEGDRQALAAFHEGLVYETNWRFSFWGDLGPADQANVRAAMTMNGAAAQPAPDTPRDPIARLVQRYSSATLAVSDAEAAAVVEPPATSIFARKRDQVTKRFLSAWIPLEDMLAVAPEAIVSGALIGALLRGDNERDPHSSVPMDKDAADNHALAGLRLSGVVVREVIDLEAAGAGGFMERTPLHLTNSLIELPLQLAHATLCELNLTGSLVAGIAAVGVRVRRDVLCAGIVLKGHSANLSSAEIAGQCDLSGIRAQPGEREVKVELSQARILGSLSLAGAGRRVSLPAVEAKSQDAKPRDEKKKVSGQGLRLSAADLRVVGATLLDKVFANRVDFSHAHVSGRLSAKDIAVLQEFILNGARIDGALSLEQACAWGREKPCRFELNQAQILGDANMRQLGWPVLADGHNRPDYMPELVAEGLNVRGKLNLIGARLRSLDLAAARIGSTLEAWQMEVSDGALSRSKAREAVGADKLQTLELKPDQAKARLVGATIQGDLVLSDAIILAGLEIYGAAIEGDCHFDGAVIGNGENAIIAMDCRVGRSIFGFTVGEQHIGLVTFGLVTFERARVRGSINLNGASLFSDLLAQSDPARGAGAALVLDDATVDGSVSLGGYFRGEADDGAEIKTVLHGRFQLIRCVIGGGMTFNGAKVVTRHGLAIYAAEATIKGGISIRTQSQAPIEQKGKKSDVEAALAGDLGNTDLPRPQEARQSQRELNGLEVQGAIDFHQTQIDGDVDFEGSTFTAATVTAAGGWRGYALNFRDARINGRLFLRARDNKASAGSLRAGSDGRFRCTGLINLNGAEIKAGLDFGGGIFKAMSKLEDAPDPKDRPGTAVDATGARIGGSVFLRRYSDPQGSPAEFCGALDFDRSEIAGDLRIGRAVFVPAPYDPEPRPGEDPKTDLILSLRNAVIQGDLRIRATERRRGLIDMTGARLRGFDDDGGGGWGERPILAETGLKLESGVRMRLDGCVYERFVPSQNSSECTEGDRRPWLLRQFPPRVKYALCEGEPRKRDFQKISWKGRDEVANDSFNMEPFESAARVLQRGGYQVQAREVSAMGMKAERKSGALGRPFSPRRMLSKLQSGLFFSYGYDPVRAVGIGGIILFVGFLGAWVQIYSGRLVDAESLKEAQKGSPSVTRLCEEAPLAYAADAMVGIDLGPQQRCELAPPEYMAKGDEFLGFGFLMNDETKERFRTEIRTPVQEALDTPRDDKFFEALRIIAQAGFFNTAALAFWGVAYTVFSSIFLFVAALTFTGVLRRDRQPN